MVVEGVLGFKFRKNFSNLHLQSHTSPTQLPKTENTFKLRVDRSVYQIPLFVFSPISSPKFVTQAQH